MKKQMLAVAAPMFAGNEAKYVSDCIESTWISSMGDYIDRFERRFAEFCGVKHAMSCCNGTAALHLALSALGVGPGDEVIVPTLTFVATANAVRYCGATPVFVDVTPETWGIDPERLEEKIGPRTRGVIVVHLFGHPVDMRAVGAIARRHGLFVVEDAAQAHGAECRGQRVGSFGDVAAFSFYGNKIISTGEGGMVVTSDDALAAKIRQLKSHGMDPARRYWHPIIGFNYRMTNVAAAVGLGQLEKVDWHLQRRAEVADWYRARLADTPGLSWQQTQAWARHVWWMFSVTLDDPSADRDRVIDDLRECGIETRPIPYPLHTLPPYRESTIGQQFPVAERIARRGINLPTWSRVTRADVDRVCAALLQAFARAPQAVA